VAYVFDEDKSFAPMCNKQTVEIRTLEAKDRAVIKVLLERYLSLTGSAKAARILNDWDAAKDLFMKVISPEFSLLTAEQL
jgi:glutamate synthase (NADPH/NADH) large chain